MIIATTPEVAEGKIVKTLGIVSGEAILGANFLRDLFAGVTDIIGGRAGGWEESLRRARDIALSEMTQEAERIGADAVVAVDLDYETIGEHGSMMMVTAAGTAVKLGV